MKFAEYSVICCKYAGVYFSGMHSSYTENLRLVAGLGQAKTGPTSPMQGVSVGSVVRISDVCSSSPGSARLGAGAARQCGAAGLVAARLGRLAPALRWRDVSLLVRDARILAGRRAERPERRRIKRSSERRPPDRPRLRAPCQPRATRSRAFRGSEESSSPGRPAAPRADLRAVSSR